MVVGVILFLFGGRVMMDFDEYEYLEKIVENFDGLKELNGVGCLDDRENGRDCL